MTRYHPTWDLIIGDYGPSRWGLLEQSLSSHSSRLIFASWSTTLQMIAQTDLLIKL